VPGPGGTGETHDVGVGTVAVTSGAASLAGWALLALLEKVTRRAVAIWTAVASVVFLLSLNRR
jgi:hypothetical protein